MSAEPVPPSRPSALGVVPDGIPEDLRVRSQSVNWRYDLVDGKWRKVPYRAGMEQRASSTDPGTWGTFDAAYAAYNKSKGQFDGVGFVVTAEDEFVGVDLDHCLTDGCLEPWAAEIVAALDSYTETTPSGDGVRVWVRGRWNGAGNKVHEGGGAIEVYDRTRYFTLTGLHRAGTPRTIEARQQSLDGLAAQYFPEKPKATASQMSNRPPAGDDAEILRRAMAAKNGAKFSRLWMGDTGDHGGDHSSADLALCSMLAFWTNRDADAVDRLFRRSGLMREKWDSRRGDTTYGAITVNEAISRCVDVYDPQSTRPANDVRHGHVESTSPLADVDRWEEHAGKLDVGDYVPPGGSAPLAIEHVSALRRRHQEREAAGGVKCVWDGILVDAGVFLGHVGPPKIGKTTLGMILARTAGRGGGELLGRAVQGRRVLVLAVEDPPYYTEALADRYFSDADDVWCFADRLKADRESLDRIVATIKAKNIGLVVLFSLSAFWRVTDENDNAQVQAHGEAIRDAARRSGVPWLLDIHSRKAEGTDGSEIRGANALAGVLDGWISQRRGARKKGEPDEVRYFEVRGRLPHGGLDIAARFDAESGGYQVIEGEKSLGPDIAERCRFVASDNGGRVTFAALLSGLGLSDGGKYRAGIRKALLADGWRYTEEGTRSQWVMP